MRSRAARRRRLLAPAKLPEQGRLRARRRRDAPGRRHALALAGHAAGHARGRRRRGKAAGATRRLRQPAGVSACRGDLRLRQGQRSPALLWLARCDPSLGGLSQAVARALRVGPARGDPRPAALRFRRAAPHARRAAPAFSIAVVEPHRRLPDSQPAAPGSRRADQASRRSRLAAGS